MRNRLLVLALLAATAGAANAQASIDPGMSKAQVVAKLGNPASEHSSGTTTILYYRNGEEKKMGMSDMVQIENDKVVDAIFRAPGRKYNGKSSSPAPVSAEAAIVEGGRKPSTHPMKLPAKKAAPAPAPTKKAAPSPAPTKKP